MSQRSPRYDFIAEPNGRAYKALIQLARTVCDRVGFVVRDFHDEDVIGPKLSQIEESIVARRQASEWPGTISLDGMPATVIEATLDPDVVAFLEREACGLYDWKAPHLPEDIYFIRADGSVWVGTVSHEAWGFSDMTDDEASLYVEKVGPIVQRRR